MYILTGGSVPIIGVGGIGSGKDAYDKLRAGASAVQVYSMLTYNGLGMVREMKNELASLMERDGFKSVPEIVGVDCFKKK